MTLDHLKPEMIDLVPDLAGYVPPARIFDKHAYSPWTGTDLHQKLRGTGIDTVIITRGETDVCVLGTVLVAVDWGSSPTRCVVRRTRRMTPRWTFI